MRDVKLIEIKESILSENNNLADELRAQMHVENTFLMNLMASPGSGKTSLIIRTIKQLCDELRIGVIEADIDSMVDAEKVAKTGVEVVQLRTGGFCHLDASMVSIGLGELEIQNLDLVIIENVGNLVCPAEFDTGAIKNVMILSIPEGDDKVLKYPLMFMVSDVLVINKMDYLNFSDFNVELFRNRVRTLNPGIEIFEVSCKTGEGIESWISWLREEIKRFNSECSDLSFS